jgi:ATP-dependent Lon protease
MVPEEKLHEQFAGFLVRKDLSKLVKGNALVPTYVLEYLLGQYCATNDEDSIKSGIETVRKILEKHYVNRNESELIRSKIKEEGRFKIIDRIVVALNDKEDVYEASFSNLGLKKVIVDGEYVKEHPKLLVGGVWCILDMEYSHENEAKNSPWIIESLKPIQISHVDLDFFQEARRAFTVEQWLDLIVQSLGFNPDELGYRNKLFQIIRLIPYCENNYNVIELGPKGTGKSHIFSEFSPHGILVSGGEVSLAKLFVNNSTGRLGLVGYWDVVAFDEFAGAGKKADKSLVDVMKNYMANRSFSRGTEQLTADASMAFVGNTSKSVSYMLKHSNLFNDLPAAYQDSAFLDRIHYYIPGWEVSIIRNEMFTEGFGFIVDYLAQVFKLLRFQDYSEVWRSHFELDPSLSTRDKEGIGKTLSGLIKILYPHKEVPKDELERLLRFAMEGRKRVKTEIYKIDRTFDPVQFQYKDMQSGETHEVETNEEKQYPIFFGKSDRSHPSAESEAAPSLQNDASTQTTSTASSQAVVPDSAPKEEHFIITENQMGISFTKLFAPYLKGAHEITIVDPYIRRTFQFRNLVEFMQVVTAVKQEGDEVSVHLITDNGDSSRVEIESELKRIQENLLNVDINFTFEFAGKHSIHARSISTDTGWKISLDRGLDIFQKYDTHPLAIESFCQEARFCKAFEVTYIKV